MTLPFNHWLQSRLTAHGYPVGPIDGTIDKLTLAALEALQRAKGLPVTGVSDEATVAALRLPSSLLPADIASAIPDRAIDKQTETTSPSRQQWPRQADVPNYFGNVGKNQTQIEVPFDMVLAWDRTHRVRKITVHKLVADSARHVFERLSTIYSAKERADIGINIFGGSLNVRRMRGGQNYSMHSWGIAIDFDPERNQLHWSKDRARLAQSDAVPFWIAWESEGWVSLGRARNFDWMHIQAARL